MNLFTSNLRICFSLVTAPEKVKGLRAEHIRRRERLYDIAVRWNKPILKPDNYTLQFDSFQFEPRLLVVSGVSAIVKIILRVVTKLYIANFNSFFFVGYSQSFFLERRRRSAVRNQHCGGIDRRCKFTVNCIREH